MKMFARIQELIDDRDSIIFVLIDEVMVTVAPLFYANKVIKFCQRTILYSLSSSPKQIFVFG